MSGTISKVYGQVYNIQGQYVKLDTEISTKLLHSNLVTLVAGSTWDWASNKELLIFKPGAGAEIV